MSLLLIVRKLWKYKLFTLPIFALVIAASAYVFAVKAPTYETGATYLLVNPPPPPTDAQIAANPELGRIESDNPYLRFSNLTVVVQVLATRLSSEESRTALAKPGADPDYKVEPSPEFGFSAPIIQITGTGTTPAAAVHTANLVGEAMTEELDRMQAIRGVDKLYRIKAELVVGAHDATLKASGKLRVLVAVFVLGTILMFIAVSVLDAIGALRVQWAERRTADEDPAGEVSLVPPVELHRNPLSDSDPDPEATAQRPPRPQYVELDENPDWDRHDLSEAAKESTEDWRLDIADAELRDSEQWMEEGKPHAEALARAEPQPTDEEQTADSGHLVPTAEPVADEEYAAEAEPSATPEEVAYRTETEEGWDLYIVDYPPVSLEASGSAGDTATRYRTQVSALRNGH
jgi:hypothetical protein